MAEIDEDTPTIELHAINPPKDSMVAYVDDKQVSYHLPGETFQAETDVFRYGTHETSMRH